MNLNNFKQRIVLLALSLLAVLLTACMSGVVKDAQTGQLIAGAQIAFQDSQGNNGTVYTDSKGYYTCDAVGGCPIPAKGPVTFTVSAPGYYTLSENRNVQYDDDPERFWDNQNFQLEPEIVGRIAFVDIHGNAWIINSDGSGKTFIAGGVVLSESPLWSPSGDKIALTINPGNYESYLAIFDRSGKFIATSPDIWDDISWSPDGHSLVYGRYFDGIYEFDLNTRETRQIIETNGRTYDHSPVWSPDGKKLVFAHHEFGTDFYVSLINFDKNKAPYKGEDQNNKKFNPGFTLIASGSSEFDGAFRFQWTSDSKRIVFSAADPADSNVGTIYVADVTTGSVVPIRPDGLSNYDVPEDVDLSHDGQRIVFSADYNLYVMDRNGSNLRELSGTGDLTNRTSFFPRWLPDGKQIAFCNTGDGGIFVVNDDGSGLTKIPNTDEAWAFDWSPVP